MALHTRAMIANQKFIYKKEGNHLKGKLKYFQHRDDRNTHIQQLDENGDPIRRWIDKGLGSSYNSIAKRCEELATSGLTNDVGARTLVLSPQVEFMAALPTERREAVMAELTETTVERWFEAMNLPQAEYAFVVHRGDVKNDRPEGVEQENREFVHSHVVLAATVPGLMEERDNYKVYKEQLEDLHRVSSEEMERIWTRELGAERIQALNQELEDLTERLQQRDQERELQALEAAAPNQQDIDEAMLEIYELTGLEAPPDLLERVYDAREAQAELDPVADLRELGFVIDDDDFDLIQDLEDLGFDFSGDTPLETERDVVDFARELGFAIPDDTAQSLTADDMDLLETYRELGFAIPRDDISPSEQLEEILEELHDLGFDIPGDMNPADANIEIEDDEIPDIEMD